MSELNEQDKAEYWQEYAEHLIKFHSHTEQQALNADDAKQKPRPISMLNIALEAFADGTFDNKIEKFYYDDNKKAPSD
jgi:hypothetical protein